MEKQEEFKQEVMAKAKAEIPFINRDTNHIQKLFLPIKKEIKNGKIIPAMSLVISMTLRFVPKFAAQLKVVTNAQRTMGRDVSNGSILQRAKHGLNILSIMATWSLENAIETADSMKSRGYGIPGRTAFSIFTFEIFSKQIWFIDITFM